MRFLAKVNSPPPGAMPVDRVDGTIAGGHGRRWRLFFAWVIVPPVLLCMAELGLRLGGVGTSTQLFLSRGPEGNMVWKTNRAFFQQFYTWSSGWVPIEFSMPKAKPPDSYRVFVFGSSAAQGVPAPDYSFWNILGTMLRANGHKGRTEIYNLALAGADSHVMRAAAKACAAHQPDLFLVYMGNNELNPYVTQAMVWDRLPPWLALRLLHVSIALNDLRLVQMLQRITGAASPDRPLPNPEDIREPERAYRYFQANVNDMCAFAKEAGAQVILCTVGTRLREWTPGGRRPVFHDEEAARQWEDAFNAGNTLRGQDRFQDALAAYTRAEAIADGHAEVAYGIACCHYALGNYADARVWFVRARETEVKHFRAGERINEVLRGIAAARAGDGVRLADSAKSLAGASPHGIEGPELFLDRVHLTFEGNWTIAGSVLETLAPMVPRFAAQALPPSLEECRQRLAMTPPDLRDQLAQTAKSTSFMEGPAKNTLERAVAELDAQIGTRGEEMRLEGCRRALQMDPQNELVRTKYVRLLMGWGGSDNALEQAKILAADFPYSCQARHLLARLLAQSGDKAQAEEETRLVLAWNPDDADANLELGQLLYDRNQPGAALSCFRAAFRLGPGAQAQSGIARALLKQGDTAGAVKAYRRSLEMAPGDPAVFEEFIAALCDAHRQTEARTEIERWRGAGSAREGTLAVLYEKSGQTQDALRLLESKVVSSAGDAASCAMLEEFLKRNAAVIPALPVWKGLAEKIPSAPVALAYEHALDETIARSEEAGQTQDALRVLESRVVASEGDAASCTALEAFLKRNASIIPAEPVWKGLAEKAASAGVWAAYERSLDEKDVEGRMGALRQVLRIAPDDSNSASNLQRLLRDKAERLEAAGDLTGAADACREAIPLNPQDNQPVLDLGNALSKSNPADRRDAWEAVWKDNPGNPLVAALCGTARAAAGDLAGAIDAFDAARRIAPEEWHYCELAADALATAGAWDDAVAAYERALTLNPGLDYLHVRLDAARKGAAGRLHPPEPAAVTAN